MQLPDAPTIYDYMILALRSKDLIATFNWDPFYIKHILEVKNLQKTKRPNLSFLHGNVAIGYSSKIKMAGPAGYQVRHDGDF
jgi:hypothetical protein